MQIRYLAGFVLLAMGSAQAQSFPPTSTATLPPEQQIEQVINKLAPGIVVKGEATPYQTLANTMAKFKVPGVSVAVIVDGKLVWAQGFGLKAADKKERVSPTTLFQAASISKPVAATAMLTMVEQGLFSLDTPINTYLKSWQLPDNEFTKTEPVTLRRLVTHSAGLNVHGFPGYAAGAPIPTVPQILNGEKPTNTEAVRVVMSPGSKWQYSGGGTTIMQLAMTDTSGEAFSALMQRLVLTPMGMSNSAYEQPLTSSKQGLAAVGHDEKGKVIAGRWHTYPELAAAGLWTTPTDLGKWAIELGEARAGKSSKVLSPAMVKEMLTEQIAPSGLGPMVHGKDEAMYFEHGGSNEGYRCFVVYFPALGRGAAIMTNGDGGAFVYRPLLTALATAYNWPDFKPREIEAVKLDSKAAQQFVGEYPFPASSPKDKPPSVFVSMKKGTLMITVPNFVPTTRAVMQANGSLITPENGFEWAFTKDDAGRVIGIEFNGRKLPKKVH